MSATMARQGGWVQLEQSDMHLDLNMAKMAIGGLSRAAIEETQHKLKEPLTEVLKERTREVQYSGHRTMMGAIEGHSAMLRQNHTDSCLSCHNGTAKNLRRTSRCNAIHAPPPDRDRQPKLEPMPPLPGTPPRPSGENEGADIFKLDNVPPGYITKM